MASSPEPVLGPLRFDPPDNRWRSRDFFAICTSLQAGIVFVSVQAPIYGTSLNVGQIAVVTKSTQDLRSIIRRFATPPRSIAVQATLPLHLYDPLLSV